MTFNFDEILNRENSHCVKYDRRIEMFGTDDCIPLWVADMDFRTPNFVIEAIKKRANHDNFGYPVRPASFYESLIAWLKRRHKWAIQKDWILTTPGIVPALNIAVEAFTKPGDKVIVQTPVYFPFFSSILENGRQMIINPLKLVDGRYEMDYEDLESKIDKRTKMLFLCNPQNPGGMAWTAYELIRLADICLKHNLLVLSDEIHCDLILSGNEHTPFAALPNGIANNTITCVAPSKTFNTPGLFTSAVIISNTELYNNFNQILRTYHLDMGNIFGTVAFEAAYNHGDEWLDALLLYIEENVRFVIDYFEKNIPKIKIMNPEATYLLWLDCRELDIEPTVLNRFFVEKAKVAFSEGSLFGTNGAGFQRMNVACPRSILRKAVQQIEKAVANLQKST